jgi:hypothetical protein
MGREFDGDATGVANTLTHALGQLDMMAIARHQVAAGLGDADDRPARLHFFQADPIVQVALDIERGHVRVGGIVEPGSGPETLVVRSSFVRQCILRIVDRLDTGTPPQ